MMIDQYIRHNQQRTVLLIIVFFSLLAILGASIGYMVLGNAKAGTILALLVALIYVISMLFQSTAVVMSLNHAKEVLPEDMPDYYRLVEDMAMVAQIPMPRVFLVEDRALNAFATGSSPEHAAVAVTTGLLEVLNRSELEAVIGHEVSHIKHYDVRLSTVAVALASAVTLIASLGGRMLWYSGGRRNRDDRENSGAGPLVLVLSLLAILLAPIGATLVQLAISREREYLADAGAVALTNNPMAMIQALEKLERASVLERPVDSASASLYISNPLKNQQFGQFFQTHPPIPERIKRLREM